MLVKAVVNGQEREFDINEDKMYGYSKNFAMLPIKVETKKEKTQKGTVVVTDDILYNIIDSKGNLVELNRQIEYTYNAKGKLIKEKVTADQFMAVILAIALENYIEAKKVKLDSRKGIKLSGKIEAVKEEIERYSKQLKEDPKNAKWDDTKGLFSEWVDPDDMGYGYESYYIPGKYKNEKYHTPIVENAERLIDDKNIQRAR